MVQIESIRAFLRYDDWANDAILQASAALTDEQLDRPFDMGPGSLRKTLQHITFAEQVWLHRWQGHAETPWPDEDQPLGIEVIAGKLTAARKVRETFLGRLRDGALAQEITYRDSRGSLFTATLGDMMLQMCIHSVHHRAQAVNMIRRLGGTPPELDYMYWVRKPA